MGDAREIIFINGPGGQGRDILDALLAGGAKVSGVLDHQGAPDVLRGAGAEPGKPMAGICRSVDVRPRTIAVK